MVSFRAEHRRALSGSRWRVLMAKFTKPKPYELQPGDVIMRAPFAWEIVGGGRPSPTHWRLWFDYFMPDDDGDDVRRARAASDQA